MPEQKNIDEYREEVQRLLNTNTFEAFDYTVRFFRTLNMKSDVAYSFIPEKLKRMWPMDGYPLYVLIDAEPGERFTALPADEADETFNIDEAYPPLSCDIGMI